MAWALHPPSSLINKMRKFMRCWVAILLIGLSAPALGQKVLGSVGGGCATLSGPQGLHTLTLTANVPAASTVLISIATLGGADFYSAGASNGNTAWVATSTIAPSFRLINVYGRITGAMSIGDIIQISFANGGGQTSCASAIAVTGISRDVFPPTDALATGTASGNSNAASVAITDPTSQEREFIHTGFAFSGNPGLLTNPIPQKGLPTVCIPNGTFCVGHNYRKVNSPGMYTGSVQMANAVPWAAGIDGYKVDVIYDDDYEG
jgi:hypothetical protein